MLEANATIFSAAAMAATTIHSNAVFMEQEWMVSIQAVWTGTPVGNFTIETSCDVGVIDPTTGLPSGISTWSTYTGSTQAAGGVAGDFTWRIANFPDRWLRLSYTGASSTGTLNARFNAKAVG